MSLRSLILDTCNEMMVPLVGIADVSRWDTPLFDPWVPPSFRPGAILPKARSVIVIGFPVHLPAIESAPSIWYREEYKTLNRLIDQYTWKFAEFLCSTGYSSVSVPRDGYGSIRVLQENPVAFFSHRHAAVLAGLGSFGRNNMVLTTEWGPRVRFGTVLSTADIEPDPLFPSSLCIRCNACVHACPVSALSADDYPDSLTDKMACSNRSAYLNKQYISPCGVCIKVCPVGKDRVLHDRTDIRIYEESACTKEYHEAWNHVRSYGRLYLNSEHDENGEP